MWQGVDPQCRIVTENFVVDKRNIIIVTNSEISVQYKY